MKKLIIPLLLMVVLIFGGCQEVLDPMTIAPSDLSEETLEILDLFNEEMFFLDINLDESIKSTTFSVWVYRDGEWVKSGETTGEVDTLSERIAIRILDDHYDLYKMDDTGHMKYSYTGLDVGFDEVTAKGSTRIDGKTSITEGEEIPLWVMIGTNSSSFSVLDIEDDFRQNECDAGIAVTMTVFNESATP